MLFFQIGSSVGLNGIIVVALIVSWVVALITLSLTSSLDKVKYWFEASSVIGAFVIFLMMVFVVQHFDIFLDKYWAELVVVVSWVGKPMYVSLFNLFKGIVVLASVLHRQWISVLGVVAPVCWLLLSPTLYVIVPIYSVCNFDDVSWGTRGS